MPDCYNQTILVSCVFVIYARIGKSFNVIIVNNYYTYIQVFDTGYRLGLALMLVDELNDIREPI